jgi:hypothetical protein
LVLLLQNDIVEFAVGNGPGDGCFEAMFWYWKTKEQSRYCVRNKSLDSVRSRFV